MFRIDTRHTFTCANNYQWFTFACDSYVPANANGMIFEVYTVSATFKDATMDKVGGTDYWPNMSYLQPGERYIWIIECDVSQQVRAWQGDGTTPTNTKFDLIGYTTSDTFHFITPVDKSNNTADSWVDIDCSANVPAGTEAILIHQYSADAAERQHAIRENGTAFANTYWYKSIAASDHQIIGVDGNRIFEQYINNANMDQWLCGYILSSEGWTIATSYTDKTPTAGSWQTIDITDIIAGSATVIIHFQNTSATSYTCALRKKGSSDAQLTYAKVNGNCTVTHTVDVDSADQFEAYIENVAVKVYVLGYLQSLNVTDSQSGFVQGKDTITNSQNCFLQGKDTSIDSQNAYVSGLLSITNSQWAYGHSAFTIINSQNSSANGYLTTLNQQLACGTGEASDFYYVDPDYTGGSNDGTAAHPWLSLTDSAWSTINTQLASNSVTIYFSARNSSVDTDQTTALPIELKRTDTSTKILTLNGKSLYNNNDTTPNWLQYGGTSRFKVYGSNSVGINFNSVYGKQNYINIIGFKVTPAIGQCVYVYGGDYLLFEDIEGWHYQNPGYGPGFMLEYATRESGLQNGGCNTILINNCKFHDTYGECIYLGGNENQFTANRHYNITVSNCECWNGAFWGGEGNGIDIKDGFINLIVNNNYVHDTERGIIINSAGLFSHNRIHDIINDGINYTDTWGQSISAHSGTIILNNLVFRCNNNINIEHTFSGIGLWNISIINNTLWNGNLTGLKIQNANGINGLTIINNISSESNGPECYVINEPSGTIIHDYNCYYRPSGAAINWNNNTYFSSNIYEFEGNSIGTNPQFLDTANENFRLAETSACINAGTTPLISLTIDLNTIPRPLDEYDIGAFEFTGDTYSVSAHLQSGVLLTDTQSAFASGQLPIVDSQQAFVNTQETLRAYRNAFLQGMTLGQPVDFQDACAEGFETVMNSQKSYCGGGLIDYQKAYIEGTILPPEYFLIDERVVFTCANHYEWHTFTCSSYVPSNTTGLIFELYTTRTDCDPVILQNPYSIKLRKKGSSEIPYGTQMKSGRRAIWMIACNDLKQVEAFATDANQTNTWKFALIGYFTSISGVTWIVPPEDISASSVSQWVTTDVSGLVGSDTTAVILRLESQDSNIRIHAVRKYGSAESQTNFVKMGALTEYVIVGIDSAKRFQQWITQLNLKCYLAGFLSGTIGWTADTEWTDITLTGTGWQTVDITSIAGGSLGIVIYLFNTDTSEHIGAVRKILSQDNNLTYQNLHPSGMGCYVMDLNSGDQFQIYRNHTSIEAKLLVHLDPGNVDNDVLAYAAGANAVVDLQSAFSDGRASILNSTLALVRGNATITPGSQNAFINAYQQMRMQPFANCNSFIDFRRNLAISGTKGEVENKIFVGDQTELTVEAWIYLTDLSTTNYARHGIIRDFWFSAGAQKGYSLHIERIDSDSYKFGFFIGDGVNYTAASFTTGTKAQTLANYGNRWLHVAGTYKPGATNLKLYLDGVEKNTATGPAQMTPNTTADYIGYGDDTAASYFIGMLTEIRVWNACKTAVDLNVKMLEKATGYDGALMACYDGAIYYDGDIYYEKWQSVPASRELNAEILGSVPIDMLYDMKQDCYVRAYHTPSSDYQLCYTNAYDWILFPLETSGNGLVFVNAAEVVINNQLAYIDSVFGIADSQLGYSQGSGLLIDSQESIAVGGNPDFTLEAWNKSDGAGYESIISLIEGEERIQLDTIPGGGLRGYFNTLYESDQFVYGPTGSVRDSEWHHVALTYEGRPKNIGSLAFDGINDFVSLGNVFSGNQTNFTIECWAYINEFNMGSGTTLTPLISNWNVLRPGQNKGYFLGTVNWNPDTIQWYFVVCDGAAPYVLTAIELPHGEFIDTYGNKWIHIAGIFRGGENLELVINGISVKTVSTEIPYMVPDISSQDWIARTGIYPNYLNGKIDELRIWSYDRTVANIIAYKDTEINAYSPGLVAYIKFNEGSGIITDDWTTNNHNGTLTGCTWDIAIPFLPGLGQDVSAGYAIVYRDGIAGTKTLIEGSVLNGATNVIIHAAGEGNIDDIRIWNITRTGSEIKDGMMRELNGNESGLKYYYRLNEGRGLIAHDTTSNNTASISGGIWSTDVPPNLRGSRDREEK